MPPRSWKILPAIGFVFFVSPAPAQTVDPQSRANTQSAIAWRYCANQNARRYAASTADSAQFIAEIATNACEEEKRLLMEGMLLSKMTAVQMHQAIEQLEKTIRLRAAETVLDLRAASSTK